ncbi:CLUMA_CG013297, isoform A [Clunio marinus]|uniref:CLUMA_CG013297, isoform A n=1 Tax=Clunio marinus TaxID=568069 RepID=A0A1J1IID4_9DIPT|nr:CLUMA_CG013297, isoform A [Clunio marinus]
MSTKLSFRARALDPSKAMPIYFAEELPDLQEYSAINRAVPQMPSGMEKEEESEHHLQRAIIAGLIIPTPEVSDVKDDGFYDKNYPADYKMPRQLIHVQPLSLEQDIPDYDMDSADEMWFDSQTKSELTPFKFEQMMDRLEKITVCSLDDAKALVRRNEVNQDVFDYWVNKRLKTKHPLILSVKTENRGNTTSNNPYIAFRRRTEKMQTRKNRKNDETSYEKMLKLRRDLSRAVKLLEMVKRREKTKREELQLSIEIYEKRYQAKDFSGQLLAEYTSAATKLRPAFAPIYSNQYHHQHSSNNSHHNQWNSTSQGYSNLHLNHHLQNNKRDFDGLSTSSSRKEKRQYKKRKHKTPREVKPIETYDGMFSSDEEDIHNNQIIASESEEEGIYPFRRNKNCDYYKPHVDGFGNWPWESPEENENGIADPKYRFNLTSLRYPRPRCIGFARRRMGRGGRILLDRASSNYDDVWSRLDYTIFDTNNVDNNNTTVDSRLPTSSTNNENKINDSTVVEKVSDEISASQTSSSNQYNHHRNNIVIKSENSKNHELSDDQMEKLSHGEKWSSISNQKLDDFEQLLDSASASSNIINKKLVCRNNSDISDDSFILRTTTRSENSNLNNQNEISTKSMSVGLLDSLNLNSEASNSGVTSTNGSSTVCPTIGDVVPVDNNNKQDEDNYDNYDIIDSESITTKEKELNQSDDFYSNFIDEIRKEWLHFRPKTPPLSPSSDIMFDSDLINDTKKFAVDLQLLDENIDNLYADNVYSSHSMSYNFDNKYLMCNDNNITTTATQDTTAINVKTEPIDGDYEFIDNSIIEDPKAIHNEAVKKLLEKYQNDVDKELSPVIDLDDVDFDDITMNDETKVGCSSFQLRDDEHENISKAMSSFNAASGCGSASNADGVEENPIKKETSDYSSFTTISSVVNVPTTTTITSTSSSSVKTTTVKEAPIAELQSHNYVLQYGSPVPQNTVSNNSMTNNTLSSSSSMNTAVESLTPVTTMFQQQFINSGNNIISTSQPNQQSRLQPIVYDSNTIVLAAAPSRKQMNGPSDRNLNQNKYKHVFMLDLTQGQDKRKAIGTIADNNTIKKTYADLGLGSQNILVSSVNSNLITSTSNLQQSSQTQQYSLVHQNALQKPIILSTSTASSLMQPSQASNTGNKIIVTPAPQIAGNVYVSTHGKLVIPSSNNSQSIILDSSKMISANNQLHAQQKLQSSHQQRVKMENKMNMLLENSGEKNIIYAKYNKNKLLQTVANIIPMQASTANKSSLQTQGQVVKQLTTINSSPQQQSVSVLSNNKNIQRIQQQQQQMLRPQYATSSINFQNSPTTSKIIQQPNNGNNILGSVNTNDNSNQVNNSNPR